MPRTKKPRSRTAAAVRYVRERRGWSREELAERMAEHDPGGDWTEQRILRIELDRTTAGPDALLALSDILEVSLDFLVRGVEVTERYPQDAELAVA